MSSTKSLGKDGASLAPASTFSACRGPSSRHYLDADSASRKHSQISHVQTPLERAAKDGDAAFHLWTVVISQDKEIELALKNHWDSIEIEVPQSSDFGSPEGRRLTRIKMAPTHARAKLQEDRERLREEMDGASGQIFALKDTFTQSERKEALAALGRWCMVSPAAATTTAVINIEYERAAQRKHALPHHDKHSKKHA